MSYDRPARRSLGHTIQGRTSFGTGRQKLVRSACRRRDAVPGFERLEDRTLLATFTDAHPTLTLTLAANDAVGIVANTSTYTLALTSGTWSGTNDGNVTGNGTATLTVQETAFNQVNLTDTGAGTSVTFNDSGSNSYASSFDVALTNSAAGPIAFNGATSFTGSNALSASTSDFIVANSGASITTVSGGITLSANQQTSSTGGNFIGINVNNATVQSATGPITLSGTGGNGGSKNYGVEIQAGGEVQTTGAAPALLINGTTNDGTSAAIMFDNGNVSTLGDVILTGNGKGGSISEAADAGPDVTAADGATFATNGPSDCAIGTSAQPIRTAIGALTATTNDGGVFISDSNAPGLIINSIAAMEGGSAAVLNSKNQVVVNGNAGTDDVSVTATGPIVLFNASTVVTTVTAPNLVTIDSTGGSILEGVEGSDNFLAKDVNLMASGSVGLAGDSIGMTVESFSSSTTNGGIFLTELIPGTEESVVAGGAGNDVSVAGSGATLGIGTITATTGTVTVQETGGALLSGTSVNIAGQTVNLTGKSGIGTVAAPFMVTAGNLMATVTDATVPILVDDTTGLASVSATTNNGDVAIHFTGGSLMFTASSSLLTASGASASFDNTGGNVVLGMLDDVGSITASGAITADPTVEVTGGTVTLTAGTGIGAMASPIDTNVTTLNASTATGDIYIVQATNPLTVSATSMGYSNPSLMTGSDIDIQTTAGDMTLGVISALGTVTLTAGGALSAPNGSAISVSANALALTASSGIGTAAAPLVTSVSTLTANGGAGGGLFLANNISLTLTSAAATGGAVAISATGDLDLGTVTAAGQAVTLTATGGELVDPTGPALNITALSATLSGSMIGAPADDLESEVSTLTASATGGGIYLSDLGTGSLTLTATAVGVGADIDFSSAGSIVLMTATAQGNTVTLNAAGSITNGNAPAVPPTPPTINITAQTLDVVAQGGIATATNPLEVLVGQVAAADGGTLGVYMFNAGPLLVTQAALEATGSGTLTFDAASITIANMGGTTATLAPGRSLLLKTETGPIVFLNPADTIKTTGAGTITVEAGMIAGSGGVAALGNLTTANQNITVTADSFITIGTLNAGTANVTVQSLHGIIIGNGASTNVIAGTATLSGRAPTLSQLQLDQTEAIAAAAAASAEAAAEQTSADAFNSQFASISGEVTTDKATVESDEATADALHKVRHGLQITLDVEEAAYVAAEVVATVAEVVVAFVNPIAGIAQAIPLIGDLGAAGIQTIATPIFLLRRYQRDCVRCRRHCHRDSAGCGGALRRSRGGRARCRPVHPGTGAGDAECGLGIGLDCPGRCHEREQH